MVRSMDFFSANSFSFEVGVRPAAKEWQLFQLPHDDKIVLVDVLGGAEFSRIYYHLQARGQKALHTVSVRYKLPPQEW